MGRMLAASMIFSLGTGLVSRTTGGGWSATRPPITNVPSGRKRDHARKECSAGAGSGSTARAPSREFIRPSVVSARGRLVWGIRSSLRRHVLSALGWLVGTPVDTMGEPQHYPGECATPPYGSRRSLAQPFAGAPQAPRLDESAADADDPFDSAPACRRTARPEDRVSGGDCVLGRFNSQAYASVSSWAARRRNIHTRFVSPGNFPLRALSAAVRASAGSAGWGLAAW